MDWTAIILGLFSGTTILSIIDTIRFRRENKYLKKSEVDKSLVSVQGEEIDLVSKYRDEILSMVDIVKDANEKNFTNQGHIMHKLDRLDTRWEKMETRVSYIEDYLNGNYHQWLSERQTEERKNKED